MIYELIPLLLSLLFLSLVVLWIAVTNRKNFKITFIVIPVTLASAVVCYLTVDKLLGYPIAETIPTDSMYLSHIESNDKDWIYVWVKVHPSDPPRAYAIENTEQNRKAMQEAAEGTEQGIAQQIGQEENEGSDDMGSGGQTKGGEYVVYDFDMPEFDALKETQ